MLYSSAYLYARLLADLIIEISYYLKINNKLVHIAPSIAAAAVAVISSKDGI